VRNVGYKFSETLVAENRHYDRDDDRQEEKNREEQAYLQRGGGYERGVGMSPSSLAKPG